MFFHLLSLHPCRFSHESDLRNGFEIHAHPIGGRILPRLLKYFGARYIDSIILRIGRAQRLIPRCVFRVPEAIHQDNVAVVRENNIMKNSATQLKADATKYKTRLSRIAKKVVKDKQKIRRFKRQKQKTPTVDL